MKKFRFQLEAALSWRRQKEQAERLRLEELTARRDALQAERGRTAQQWEESHRRTLAQPGVSAEELQSLDAFHRGATARIRRIDAEIQQIAQAVRAQQNALVEASRQTRLLEKLKDRQLAAWKVEFEKQIESDAAESYLAQWSQNREL
jgi:hypothetical protein